MGDKLHRVEFDKDNFITETLEEKAREIELVSEQFQA